MNKQTIHCVCAAILVLASALGCGGCGGQEPSTEHVGQFDTTEPAYILGIVLDCSGSCQPRIQSAEVWNLINQMLGQMFQNRAGEDDLIILANISSAPQGPIFAASPRKFREKFGSAEGFRQFMAQY